MESLRTGIHVAMAARTAAALLRGLSACRAGFRSAMVCMSTPAHYCTSCTNKPGSAQRKRTGCMGATVCLSLNGRPGVSKRRQVLPTPRRWRQAAGYQVWRRYVHARCVSSVYTCKRLASHLQCVAKQAPPSQRHPITTRPLSVVDSEFLRRRTLARSHTQYFGRRIGNARPLTVRRNGYRNC